MAKKMTEAKKAELSTRRVHFSKTNFPGVLFIETRNRDGKKTKTYYLQYRSPDKKQHFEPAGKAANTPSKANVIRTARIKGQELPNRERRAEEEARKSAEGQRWTFDRLMEGYRTQRGEMPGPTEKSYYKKHLAPFFGDKTPTEIIPLDVDRIKHKLQRSHAPGTVAKVLELLRRLINYASKKSLSPPPAFKIELPEVHNEKTEDLSPRQMDRLLKVLRGEIKGKAEDGSPVDLDPDAREMMLLALLSGMRRGEIFKLTWDAVDFRRGFISIRNPKGGKDQTIPMSDPVRELLTNRSQRIGTSGYVFPGRREGMPVTDVKKSFGAIKTAAELPADFRPMHGLRHTFASHLASSGEVDLYTLQKLLTHKSPLMTQRYSHLRDDTLKRAASVMGRIMEQPEKDTKNSEASNE